MSNPVVYFDVAIGPRVLGRLEFELFAHKVPRTAENFRALCTGEKGLGASGVPLHFKGCAFHRVISGFMAQCGDFTHGDGTGGESIYGAHFQDENFSLRHDKKGLLSMANAGAHTNGSQFFITFKALPHLDNRHVVFGGVKKGLDVLTVIEKVSTDASDRPKLDVTVVECGQVESDWSDVAAQRKEELVAGTADQIQKAKDAQSGKGGAGKAGGKELEEEKEKEEQEAAEEEAVVDVETATQGMSAAQKRLFLVRMKMNQGRKANKAEAELEYRRNKDPKFAGRQAAFEKNEERRRQGLVAKTGIGKANGNSSWGVRMDGDDASLQVTLQQAEWSETSLAKKAARQRAHGQDATREETLFDNYKKSLLKLPGGGGEGSGNGPPASSSGSAKRSLDAGSGSVDDFMYGSAEASKVSSAGLQRLARHMQDKEEAIIASKLKKRKIDADKGPSINAANEKFNKQAARAFDKYTLEIRQNLERGSAL